MLNGKGQRVLCSSPGGTWLIRALLCVVRFMLVLQLGMVLINFICFGFPCDSRAAQNPLPWRSPLLQNLLALLWGLHVANQNGTEMAGCPVWKSVALCFWGMLCSVGGKKSTKQGRVWWGEEKQWCRSVFELTCLCWAFPERTRWGAPSGVSPSQFELFIFFMDIFVV